MRIALSNVLCAIQFAVFRMGPTGRVVGIDHIPELVKMSIENILTGNPDLLETGRVKLVGKWNGSVLVDALG